MTIPNRPGGGPPARPAPRPPTLKTLLRERRAQLVDFLAPLRRFLGPGYPLSRGESYRPFFIVGTPRSGNTLLRRVLLAHPRLHVPPENFALRHSIRLFRQYRRLMRWEQLVELLLAEFRRPPFSDNWELGDLRPLAGRLKELPTGERSLAALLHGLYALHAETHGKAGARWGDKTPSNIYCLHRLPAVFPDARVIFLMRDPADVAYSWTGLGENSVEKAARRWIYTADNARVFARWHPEACLFIRYEDLVTRTEETIRGLAGFLDLELAPATLSAMIDSQGLAETMGDVPDKPFHRSVGEEIHARHIGKGRRHLSPEQKRELDAILGAYGDAFGYERLAGAR